MQRADCEDIFCEWTKGENRVMWLFLILCLLLSFFFCSLNKTGLGSGFCNGSGCTHTLKHAHTYQDVNVIRLQRARLLCYGWLASTKWAMGQYIWQNWVKKYSPSMLYSVKLRHTGSREHRGLNLFYCQAPDLLICLFLRLLGATMSRSLNCSPDRFEIAQRLNCMCLPRAARQRG